MKFIGCERRKTQAYNSKQKCTATPSNSPTSKFYAVVVDTSRIARISTIMNYTADAEINTDFLKNATLLVFENQIDPLLIPYNDVTVDLEQILVSNQTFEEFRLLVGGFETSDFVSRLSNEYNQLTNTSIDIHITYAYAFYTHRAHQNNKKVVRKMRMQGILIASAICTVSSNDAFTFLNVLCERLNFTASLKFLVQVAF